MIFNFDFWSENGSVGPGSVMYDGSDASGWEAFAPAWEGQTAWIPRDASSSIMELNPVGCTKKANSLEVYFKIPPTEYNQGSHGGFANGAFRTINRINLSGYTKLHVQATYAYSNGVRNQHYCVCGVITQDNYHPPENGTDTPPGVYKTLSSGETIFDISSINSGYLYFGGSTRGQGLPLLNKAVDIRVTKVWLT